MAGSWAEARKIELEAKKVRLPPPLKVSPFIRACRWTALIAGISWGLIRQRQLSKKENALRAYKLEQKPMVDAKAAADKRRRNIDEMKSLAVATGTPIPPHFEETFK